MKAWTKEEALKALTQLVAETDQLQRSKRFSVEHTTWTIKCLETFEEIFGRASRYYLSFAALDWRFTGTFIPNDFDIRTSLDVKHHEAYLKQLGIAKGLLLASINYLNERELDEVYSAKDTGPEASLILKVLHLAERQLRKVIREKPDNEKQVQNAFQDLLIGADIPHGREVDSIEYSSKTYTPDFSLPKISLAIEVKLCGRTEREKEIIAEINDDILAYQTKYPNLLFIVYDLGYIRDVDRFCGGFGEHENVTIKVVKH